MYPYLIDYKMTYERYCDYMSFDSIWGDIICLHVLSMILNIPITVLTPHMTWSANEDLHGNDRDLQFEVVLIYNGFNHYTSTSEYYI